MDGPLLVVRLAGSDRRCVEEERCLVPRRIFRSRNFDEDRLPPRRKFFFLRFALGAASLRFVRRLGLCRRAAAAAADLPRRQIAAFAASPAPSRPSVRPSVRRAECNQSDLTSLSHLK